MIYVSVGTQKFQFNRLITSIDKMVGEKEINEEVFAQIGHCDYLPQNIGYKTFLSGEEFDNYVKKCDLLITHSGVATIMAGLKYGKPVLVVPRLSKYGEHVDDHQVQIAKAFSEQNFLLMCSENDDIEEKVKQAKIHKFSKYESKRELVIKTIQDYLSTI